MGKALLIASGKGGTGKTSLSAGLGAAFAAQGLNTLLIDADIGNRSLDIVLGMSDCSLFSFADVCAGRISLSSACAENSRLANLKLLTAPTSDNLSCASPEQIKSFIFDAKNIFDRIIIDCAAGFGKEIELFAPLCNFGIIISTRDGTALRGAEKMASYLINSCGLDNTALVINRVRSGISSRFFIKNIDDAIDSVSIPLIGIIPEDSDVYKNAERGQIILSHKKNHAGLAYYNISKRISGEYIPLSFH